jgi:hypothetical protein
MERLPDPDRHEHHPSAAFYQERDLLAGLADLIAQLLRACDSSAVDRQDHVSRLNAGLSRGTLLDVLDHQAPICFNVGLFICGEWAHGKAKLE